MKAKHSTIAGKPFSALIIPMPTGKKRDAGLDRAKDRQIKQAFNLAHQHGWTALNADEKKLIEFLRCTTYRGRNYVMDVAIAMRQKHPWVDGSLENTQE